MRATTQGPQRGRVPPPGSPGSFPAAAAGSPPGAVPAVRSSAKAAASGSLNSRSGRALSRGPDRGDRQPGPADPLQRHGLGSIGHEDHSRSPPARRDGLIGQRPPRRTGLAAAIRTGASICGRNGDQAVGGDAAGDGGRRGGRRLVRRRPDRQPAPGRRGRADRQGGRALPADRRRLQPDRHARLRAGRAGSWSARRRPMSAAARRGPPRACPGSRSAASRHLGAACWTPPRWPRHWSPTRTTWTRWTWWRSRTPTRWAAVRCSGGQPGRDRRGVRRGRYPAVPGRRAHLQRERGHRGDRGGVCRAGGRDDVLPVQGARRADRVAARRGRWVHPGGAPAEGAVRRGLAAGRDDGRGWPDRAAGRPGRLATDHANAARLAARDRRDLPGAVDPAAVETNIIFVDVAGPATRPRNGGAAGCARGAGHDDRGTGADADPRGRPSTAASGPRWTRGGRWRPTGGAAGRYGRGGLRPCPRPPRRLRWLRPPR